jgi:hypothetical protein
LIRSYTGQFPIVGPSWLAERSAGGADAGLALDPDFKIRRMIDGALVEKAEIPGAVGNRADGMRKAGLPEA